MAVSIFEGTESWRESILDCYNMKEGTLYHRIFLVTKVTKSRTQMDKVFYRLYIKDVNGKTFIARIFNINKDISPLEGKICAGNISMQSWTDDSIEFTLETLTDFDEKAKACGLGPEMFIGKVESTGDLASAIFDTLPEGIHKDIIKANSLIDKCRRMTMEDVYDGKIGSGLYFMYRVCNTIDTLALNKQIADICKLQFVFCWTSYLIEKDVNDLLSVNTRVTNRLNSINKVVQSKTEDKDFSVELLHTWESISEIDTPKTIFSIIVKESVNSVKNVERIYNKIGYLDSNLGVIEIKGEKVTKQMKCNYERDVEYVQR